MNSIKDEMVSRPVNAQGSLRSETEGYRALRAQDG
jgi:hypothetical protein